MRAVPAPTPITNPLPLTVATAWSDDDHVSTASVTALPVESVTVGRATIFCPCCSWLGEIDTEITAIDARLTVT